MEKEFAQLGFHKIDIPITVETDSVNKAIAFNGSADIELDPDLMYAGFIMVHEGANDNGDYFTKEVLQQAKYTPKFKPIDWEHGQPVIGTILDSDYREDANNKGYIEAVGVIWKFIYPELSELIKKKSATGELRLSMECYWRDADYMVGDVLYNQEQADKMGISNYVGKDYMGKKVYRVFKEVIFGGVGVVANPADKEAVFLSVAKDLNMESGSSKEVLSSVADMVNRVINDFTKKKEDSTIINAVAIARIVKAFDKAKGEIVSKLNKKEIESKEQVLQEVDSVLKSFYKEITDIRNDYYMGIANRKNSEKQNDLTTELSFDEIISMLSHKLSDYYFNINNHLEAYLIRVYEDYLMYELVDHSTSFPYNGRLFKAPYKIIDGEITIYFDSQIEVELVYQEKAEKKEEESEESMVNKEKQIQETAAEKEGTEVAKEKTGATDTKDYSAQIKALEQEKDVLVEEKKNLIAELESLKEELKTEKENRLSVEEKLGKLQAIIENMEKEKLAQTRLAELQGLGIVFSGSRLEKELLKLKTMSDEEYADYKELLIEIVSNKTAEASEKEENVVIENSNTASAGLNIEQKTKEEKRPFSIYG